MREVLKIRVNSRLFSIEKVLIEFFYYIFNLILLRFEFDDKHFISIKSCYAAP